MSVFIPQMEPVITAEDADAVTAYMRSGAWLTEFEHTRRFEQMIAEYTGARFCTIAPNGTLALFLALVANGIGHGDEVIVPDLTMAASATAVVMAGATVVFGDIDPVTLCLDLTRVDERMTPRTRAVMFVSLNGRAPAALSDFARACRARGIAVIEDAAQSLGSFVGGKHLGTFGDCGCFSFSSQKIVTTGQGGAVVTDDEALFQRMKRIRDFGRSAGGSDHYLSVGWNLKFTDLQAVIGVEQMRRLPRLVEGKRRMYALYQQHLDGVSGIELPATDLTMVSPWFIDVLVKDRRRTALAEHLKSEGIGSRPFYPALHAEPAFGYDGSFPVAQLIAEQGLWLPSSLNLGEHEIERVCASIRRFF
ncbi:MAG: DegT/DnrJ/EryC1/StrS aminotransferase family protein [Gemmatimonadetes bacterium]|nr:DegT/DnrJ/EryC1/StrS aminotransferase family protein [Gemmatimonadota bacterium]